ncbi:MAG: hypothetical protein ABJ015_27615, partial [Rhodopirellula bahusiensis]
MLRPSTWTNRAEFDGPSPPKHLPIWNIFSKDAQFAPDRWGIRNNPCNLLWTQHATDAAKHPFDSACYPA